MSDLPQPNEAFEWVQAAAGPALVCRPLARVAAHVFTTRSWPLGAASVRDEDAAWRKVAEALNVGPAQLARVKQVHGVGAVSAADALGSPIEADIVMTADPTAAVAVQAADCVPILIADGQTGAVAAVHAGWRGLAQRAPARAVEALRERYGACAADLTAAIGPAVAACCYEVGRDVRGRFAAAEFAAERIDRWFSSLPVRDARNPPMRPPGVARRDHWFLDGAVVAREQLEAAGVPPDAIFVAGLCTASHPETLCSYRRDEMRAGRIAAAIRSGRRPSPSWPGDRHAGSTRV